MGLRPTAGGERVGGPDSQRSSVVKADRDLRAGLKAYVLPPMTCHNDPGYGRDLADHRAQPSAPFEAQARPEALVVEVNIDMRTVHVDRTGRARKDECVPPRTCAAGEIS